MPNRVICCLIILFMVFCFNKAVSGEEKPPMMPGNASQRDPFIPLIDDKGNLRKIFTKPINEQMVAQVNLAGISKINNVFYAIIDGEWVKEGDTIKDLTIEKIQADKVILKFGEKRIEVMLDREKKP